MLCAKNLLRCPKRDSCLSLKDFEGPEIYCQRHFHGEKLAEQEHDQDQDQFGRWSHIFGV